MLPSPPPGQRNSGNVFIVNCCSSDLERNVAWCRLHFIVPNSHRHCSWKSYEEKVLVIILILSVDRAYPGELCLAPAVIHSCSLTDTSRGNVPHSEVGTLTAVVYRHPTSCAVVQLPIQITSTPPHWNQLTVRTYRGGPGAPAPSFPVKHRNLHYGLVKGKCFQTLVTVDITNQGSRQAIENNIKSV